MMTTRGAVHSSATRASAVAGAAEMIAAVLDHPHARLEIASRIYLDHADRGGLEQYARSELAFMRWEIERGVLNPPDHERPGSPWWRAVNASLLRDAAEADLLAQAGVRRGGSTGAVDRWLDFLYDPAPAAWYCAHNASVASAYLGCRHLANVETLGEQALMNVVLYRVLFAHVMIANPPLALGHLGFLGRLVGDPRNDVVDWVVHVPDFYPRRYPLHHEHERSVFDAIVDAIDDAIVERHIDGLYAFEAEVLGLPELATLVQEGRLCYPSLDAGAGCHRGGFLTRMVAALLAPVLDDLAVRP